MTVSDVLPLPPCRADKRGRHHMNAIIPGTDEGFVTMFCEACCAVRRMPVSGQLYTGSLDAQSATTIRKAVSG